VTNTPSEGSSAAGPAGFSAEQQAAIQLMLADALAAQRRELAVRAPSRVRRLFGRATTVAVGAGAGAAAGAGAMTGPGQAAIRAIGDAGQYVGSEAAEAGRGIAGATTDAWNSTVQGAENLAHDVAETATNAWNGFSGWATDAAAQAWGVTQDVYHAVADPVVTAGQHVSAFAAQYAEHVVHNPANTATTAALAAGAVAALNPQAREAVARAATATSRWVKGAASDAREELHNAYLGARVAFDSIRSNPRIQSALKAVGLGSKETHTAVTEANEITGGESRLPKVEEVSVGLAPGHDPAMAPAGSKVPTTTAQQTGQSTGTQGLGEAGRTGAGTETKKGGTGQGL
jgi:hypothetical protein